MTDLISSVARSTLGIDTIYRGFLWSAMSLHVTLKQNVGETDQRIRISTPSYSDNSTVRVRAELPINRINYFTTNAERWQSIETLTVGLAIATAKNTPATVAPIAPIPADPVGLDTLEKYLAWTATLIQLAYFNLVEPNFNAITYQVLPDQNVDTGQIQAVIDYAVPIDPFVYGCTDNLIRAVIEPAAIAACP